MTLAAELRRARLYRPVHALDCSSMLFALSGGLMTLIISAVAGAVVVLFAWRMAK
jgi:uncharacterized membrane protein YeaQ/YmgE (transglycosylase-associated protein family)